MTLNPFTGETRAKVVTIRSDSPRRLRMPSSLHRLLKHCKPTYLSESDFLLKGALDEYLLHEISVGRYDRVQTALEVFFGPVDHNGSAQRTDVAA